MMFAKAHNDDFLGRFREVISDPLNLLIERVQTAGMRVQIERMAKDYHVYLHNGNRVPLTGEGAYYGPFSQLLVINRGVHEPLEEYVFQELLKIIPEAPLMIELGAYWAHYSMWLKKVRPGSSVILVEPNPEHLAAGRRNFELNGFSGEFIQSSVGRGHLEVDALFSARHLSRADILHVDIQGAELEMLQGCQTTLRNLQIDYLFISTHSQEIHHRVVTELNTLGYRVEISSDFDNDSTSFDGLVFASSPKARQLFTSFALLGRRKIIESGTEDLLRGLHKIQNRTS